MSKTEWSNFAYLGVCLEKDYYLQVWIWAKWESVGISSYKEKVNCPINYNHKVIQDSITKFMRSLHYKKTDSLYDLIFERTTTKGGREGFNEIIDTISSIAKFIKEEGEV